MAAPKTHKRGNQEGTVYEVAKRGGWRAALTAPDGTRRYVSGKTRAEAAAKLVQLQARLGVGLPLDSGDRFGTFLDWWLANLEAKAASGSKSVNTVDNARWAVETWIRPALGSHRLRDLEPEDVERLLAAMAKAGKSKSSIIRVRSYLGQVLAVAERRGKVARNVARL